MNVRHPRRSAAAALCAALLTTSCGFQGVNSLPLPGAVASGSGGTVYHVVVSNVRNLESNSPVMMSDVIVGSVGRMRLSDWKADVEIRIRDDVAVPANAVAKIGQTSLLGSMHIALDPPAGEQPVGRLSPGATIGTDRSYPFPSTEQTLASISAVVNAGGLGQMGDVIHGAATALAGRSSDIRQLIGRLDSFVGIVDAQRGRFVESINAMDRLAQMLADQRDDITDALQAIPPALDVLLQQRALIVTALDKLGELSRTATDVVNTSKDNLTENLENLAPVIQSLADVGPQLGLILSYLPSFPFSQNLIDRGVRGDYFNLFAAIDLTVPRLKRSLLLGTRWGDPNAEMVPAPGDPTHLNYTYEPLNAGVAPPSPTDAPQSTPFAPEAPPPLLPVTPSPSEAHPPAGPSTPIFAGPYPPSPPREEG